MPAIRRPGVGAVREEQVRHRRVAAFPRRRASQRHEAAAGFSRIHIGAGRKEQLRDLDACFDVRRLAEAARRGVQRRLSALAARVDVGASRQQQLRYGRMAVGRRGMERPLVELVPRLDVRARRDEQIREVLSSEPRS